MSYEPKRDGDAGYTTRVLKRGRRRSPPLDPDPDRKHDARRNGDVDDWRTRQPTEIRAVQPKSKKAASVRKA